MPVLYAHGRFSRSLFLFPPAQRTLSHILTLRKFSYANDATYSQRKRNSAFGCGSGARA
jgi:hypothetical protein